MRKESETPSGIRLMLLLKERLVEIMDRERIRPRSIYIVRDLIGSRSNVPLINCVVPFRIVRSRRCACTLILFRLSWFP